MKHSLAFEFKGAKPSSKKGADETKVFSAIASTPALDRYNEVLLPLGMEYKNFLENPVMLMIHDYSAVPVAKVLNITVDEKAVEFDFEFDSSEDGQKLQRLYEQGFMSAFSVGLYPKKYTSIDSETADQIELEVADGKKQEVDLSVYKTRPDYIVNQWELLEISPVSVPANPEALIKREAEHIVRKSFDGKGAAGSGAAGMIFEKRLNDEMSGLLATLKSFEDFEGAEVLSVVPIHSVEVQMDESWNASDALVNLSIRSTSDGSGDKGKMDWGEFSKGFGWVDLDAADTLTGYKYAHHLYNEDKFVASMAGVRAAMADLLTDTSVVGKDAEAIYAHLANHYEDAGEKAPEFSKDYSEDDLEEIKSGLWEEDLGDSSEGDESEEESSLEITLSSDLKELVAKLESVASLKDKFAEFEKSMGVRLGVQFDLLTSMKSKVDKLSSKAVEQEGKDEQEEETPDDVEYTKAFDGFLSQIDETLEVNG